MSNKVDMADLCELAHTLTVRECAANNIQVDCTSDTLCGDSGFHDEADSHYTADAQEVFDYYYDTITNTLGV